MTSVGRILASTIKGSWLAERPIWTGWPARECASPTITRKRVVPPDARTSSLVNYQFGPASRRSDRLVQLPGCRRKAPTIATVLKSMGYATGQFGKNHLGDRNEF